MLRYNWFSLILLVSGEAIKSSFKCDGYDLSLLSIRQIQRHYADKKLSPGNVTRCYLNRIGLLNEQLRAVIQVNPDAEVIASDYVEFPRIEPGTSLWGIPVLIQDDMATLDKMETTSGSLALMGIKPTRESEIVTKLLASGAIIIGKTNMAEFRGLRFSKEFPAYSSRGGFVKHPFIESKSVYGASAGAAVAVASNLAMIGICSSIEGSIESNAAALGVIGFTLTSGIISTKGNVPSIDSIQKIGYFTHDIEDSLTLTKILAPAVTSPEFSKKTSTCPSHHNNDFPKDLNIGILNQSQFFNMGVLTPHPHINTISFYLKLKGALVTKVNSNETYTLINQNLLGITYEFEKGINDYLFSANFLNGQELIHNCQDLVKYYREHQTNSAFPDNLIDYHFVSPDEINLAHQQYISSLVQTRTLLSNLMQKNLIKVMILPAQPNGPLETIPSNLGFPTITIPLDYHKSYPIGLTLIALPHHESILLELSSELLKRFPSKLHLEF